MTTSRSTCEPLVAEKVETGLCATAFSLLLLLLPEPDIQRAPRLMSNVAPVLRGGVVDVEGGMGESVQKTRLGSARVASAPAAICRPRRKRQKKHSTPQRELILVLVLAAFSRSPCSSSSFSLSLSLSSRRGGTSVEASQARWKLHGTARSSQSGLKGSSGTQSTQCFSLTALPQKKQENRKSSHHKGTGAPPHSRRSA